MIGAGTSSSTLAVATPSVAELGRAADRLRSRRRAAPVRHSSPPPGLGWSDLWTLVLTTSIGWLLVMRGLGVLGG